jgi:hypothetical protein
LYFVLCVVTYALSLTLYMCAPHAGKEQPASYVTEIAQRMHRVHARDVLIAPYLYRKLDMRDVGSVLSEMQADRALVIIADPVCVRGGGGRVLCCRLHVSIKCALTPVPACVCTILTRRH